MKNVNLHYGGGIKKVLSAVKKANEILSSNEFYDQIRAYRKFDNSPLSPEIIARLMQESGHRIDVSVHWVIPPVKTKHDKITISGWEFSSDLGKGVNNLIYETVGSITCLYDLLHHKQEVKQDSTHTAHWVIGTIAEIMVK